jgi:hypothetical protein
MKFALGTFAAVLLAGGMVIQPAHAQSGPQGSYLNSCRHVGMEGDRLFADCRRMDGGWQRTVLDIDRCAGDISNLDGRLTCNGGSREGYGSSYRGRDEWRAEQRARCSGIPDPYERERCWRGQ